MGHLIGRKGILDFLELARMMPKVQFIWFGGGNESLVTAEIKEAISKKPDNVLFAGFVSLMNCVMHIVGQTYFRL